MISFQKINSVGNVLSKLHEFGVCFPGLTNRIDDAESYSRKLYEFGNVYTLIFNQNTIGFVAFYANDKINGIGYISLIGILPDYQGKGYGTRLLTETKNAMKAFAMKEIQLEVDSDNLVAIDYYKRNGFEMIGKARETSYYMRCTL